MTYTANSQEYGTLLCVYREQGYKLNLKSTLLKACFIFYKMEAIPLFYLF
jgi:hypothetical protein